MLCCQYVYIPQWTGATQGQEVSYAINSTLAIDSFNFKDMTGLDFDATTGSISGIPNRVLASIAHNY